MKDKVQKIREELERRIDNLPKLNPKTTEGADATLLYGIYMSILNFIDSLQEEPVSKVWHDASKLPDNSEDIVIEHSEYGTAIIPACKMSRVKGAKWARLEDILKL